MGIISFIFFKKNVQSNRLSTFVIVNLIIILKRGNQKMCECENDEFVMEVLFDMYINGKQNIDISLISKECDVDERIVSKLKRAIDERIVKFKS